jgi:hypothetical protein
MPDAAVREAAGRPEASAADARAGTAADRRTQAARRKANRRNIVFSSVSASIIPVRDRPSQRGKPSERLK